MHDVQETVGRLVYHKRPRYETTVVTRGVVPHTRGGV